MFVLLALQTPASNYESHATVNVSDTAPIFIDMQALRDLKILRALPVVTPDGDGGKPGVPAQAIQAVVQSSTAEHPKLTIVLNPLKPENNRQAIQQKLSAPDLKIQVEQQVPDIVLIEDAVIPKPQVDMRIHQPLARESVLVDQAAPTIASNSPELPMKIASPVQQPQMPVSYLTSSLQAPHERGDAADQRISLSVNRPENPPGGIVVVSVDPAAFSQLATLAQGNRYAALAIAPSKEGPGSPGETSKPASGAGSNGIGKGGDTSSGIGAGHSGGGAGRPEGQVRASLSTTGGSGLTGGVDVNNLLGPVLPEAIYPVNTATKLRRAPLVISAGPIGGGGLDVYGALTCGKVYSIFLPMPGKNWVLQYCAHVVDAIKPEQTSAGVVRMQAGLIPPSAEEQFDFRRLPVPEKDADKLIVLRGTIQSDGAVTGVNVFRGVRPEMDSQAALAFGKWKFKPATRAGVPVDVDVLVGIPARLPDKKDEDFSKGLASHEQ